MGEVEGVDGTAGAAERGDEQGGLGLLPRAVPALEGDEGAGGGEVGKEVEGLGEGGGEVEEGVGGEEGGGGGVVVVGIFFIWVVLFIFVASFIWVVLFIFVAFFLFVAFFIFFAFCNLFAFFHFFRFFHFYHFLHFYLPFPQIVVSLTREYVWCKARRLRWRGSEGGRGGRRKGCHLRRKWRERRPPGCIGGCSPGGNDTPRWRCEGGRCRRRRVWLFGGGR